MGPSPRIYPANNDLYQWPYVYLHGKAEEIMAGHYEAHNIQCAPDIFHADEPIPEVGTHLVTIFGVPAVVNIVDDRLGPYKTGRIALISDTEALKHVLTPEEWA